MVAVKTDIVYEIRLAFEVSKELISNKNWKKDELDLLVNELLDTADAYFDKKGIETGTYSTEAHKVGDRSGMDWFDQ